VLFVHVIFSVKKFNKIKAFFKFMKFPNELISH